MKTTMLNIYSFSNRRFGKAKLRSSTIKRAHFSSPALNCADFFVFYADKRTQRTVSERMVTDKDGAFSGVQSPPLNY